MNQALSECSALEALQTSLRDAGAARFDAVGWHYIEVLSQRARAQTGHAQALLYDKLTKALAQFKSKLDEAPPAVQGSASSPSPLATLLSEMAQHTTAPLTAPPTLASKPAAWRAESTRVQQFKKELNKISVQKQVEQAIAMAPQNAGPINSHMLVLRSLGHMRDASADYLNRFMGYVDTLLCLDECGASKTAVKKSAPLQKSLPK